MSLDINTPKGQRSLQREQEMVKVLQEEYPTLLYVQTPKKRESAVDAMLVDKRSMEIQYVVEQKTRQITEETWQYYNHTWLITTAKVKKLQEICRLLCVPGMGLLYMPPQGLILCRQLVDSAGNMLVTYEDHHTLTQETINKKDSPKVMRENRYIDMKGAKKITCAPIAYRV